MTVAIILDYIYFYIVEKLRVGRVKMLQVRRLTNFVAISRAVAEIRRFLGDRL